MLTVPEQALLCGRSGTPLRPCKQKCALSAGCLALRVPCPLFICCAMALQISSQILGYGSGGTLVFEGELDGRPVAIKRILHQFYDLAKKEIGALILSDEVSACLQERCSCSLMLHQAIHSGSACLHIHCCCQPPGAWAL